MGLRKLTGQTEIKFGFLFQLVKLLHKFLTKHVQKCLGRGVVRNGSRNHNQKPSLLKGVVLGCGSSFSLGLPVGPWIFGCLSTVSQVTT